MTDPYDPANRPPPPSLEKQPQEGPPSGYEPPPGYGPPSGYGSPAEQQGYGPPSGYQGAPPPGGYGTQKKNGFGVAALVLGIAAILLFWTFVGGIVLGIMAIAFGVLGRKRVSRGEADNGGMALAGIITGAVGLAITLVIVVVAIVAFFRGDVGSLVECSDAAQTQEQLDQCSLDFGDSVTE